MYVVKQISEIKVIFTQALTQVINSLYFLLIVRRNPISIQNPLTRRVLAFLYPLFLLSPVSHLLTFGIKNNNRPAQALRFLIPKSQPAPRIFNPIRYQNN